MSNNDHYFRNIRRLQRTADIRTANCIKQYNVIEAERKQARKLQVRFLNFEIN